MAGIEPASERLSPRISTSVFGWFLLPAPDQPTKQRADQPLGLLSPLSCTSRQNARHSDFYDTFTASGRTNGLRRRGLNIGGQLTFISLMQREAEQHSLCFWHLFFVLILRDRYLSARNPEPASPVEACHPRNVIIIHHAC